MADNELFTEYDEMLQTKELQIIKAILPYLNNQNKKTVSMLIQYVTMNKAINLMNKNNSELGIAEYTDEKERRISMLNAIKKFCTPKEQDTIDNFINMLYVMDNYENMIS